MKSDVPIQVQDSEMCIYKMCVALLGLAYTDHILRPTTNSTLIITCNPYVRSLLFDAHGGAKNDWN
jgi:hypothetical protein